ncbi:MAG TPA: hypothetical protein VFU97_24910 [Xanthobacteraceae bacterium]|jgi:hypothetical protein|nr:hypothetical protein [Xanthobacteraceae bacterium]
MGWLREGIPSAGLVCGPAAWGVSTQLNYSLVGTGHGNFPTVPVIALVLVVISLAGGLLSWRAWRRMPEPVGTQATGMPRTFLSGLGAMSAFLFAAVIVLQGVAGAIVP